MYLTMQDTLLRMVSREAPNEVKEKILRVFVAATTECKPHLHIQFHSIQGSKEKQMHAQ